MVETVHVTLEWEERRGEEERKSNFTSISIHSLVIIIHSITNGKLILTV